MTGNTTAARCNTLDMDTKSTTIVYNPTMLPGMLEVRVSPCRGSAPDSLEVRCCRSDSYPPCTIDTNRLTGDALDAMALVLRAVLGNGKLEASERGRGSDGGWWILRKDWFSLRCRIGALSLNLCGLPPSSMRLPELSSGNDSSTNASSSCSEVPCASYAMNKQRVCNKNIPMSKQTRCNRAGGVDRPMKSNRRP